MDDRRMTLSRLFRASPEQVWNAWTDPAILPRWFGPKGYSCQTKEIDLRQGGLWRFDMIGPDGKVWPNRHRFTLYEPYSRIEFLLDDDTRADPPMQAIIVLTPEAGGTRLDQTMIFPTTEAKQAAEGFGAVELGHTTLAKLAAILGE